MLQLLFPIFCFISLFSHEKTSTHSIKKTQEEVSYTATVGSGQISYIAYTKEGSNRPITFAFNGGPGSSSVWLHLGCFGPRRVLSPEEGQAVSPPYQLVDNTESILDLTDLVFIDPVGTGLSKAATKEDENKFYSVNGDISSVAEFIRDYLTEHKRWNSPVYLAGESYGALRAAGLANYCQEEFGIYFNGIILVSAAIDYQTLCFSSDNPLPFFLFLPTYATTAWYHNQYRSDVTIEEVAASARKFAYETYAPALICRKCFDQGPICDELAEMTGLSPNLVRRLQGRIDEATFFNEFLRDEGKMVGRFDSRILGSVQGYSPTQDPSSDLVWGIFSGALHEYLHKELDSQNSYKIFSSDAHSKWDFNNSWGQPNLMNGLRRALRQNPSMKVFVGCGYFDLATPFATVEYCFDHLDVPEASVQMEYYEGGHMYYLNPKARVKFKQDLVKFYGN